MRALILLLLSTLGLLGCQTAPDRSVVITPLLLSEAESLFPLSSAVESHDEVFQASEDIKRFVRTHISYGSASSHDRFERLIKALSDDDLLAMEYDSLETLSASQSFQRLRGNCLSLSILAYTLAKEAGLQADFYEPEVPYVWDEQGAYHFLTRHISVKVYANTQTQWPISSAFVDFSGNPSLRFLPKARLATETVLAMFYNNRAADALARERFHEAFAYGRQAIAADPDFAPPYNTLGLLFKRMGRVDLAENAFRHGLMRDRDNYALLSSLHWTLQQSGNADDQVEAAYLRAERKQKNPFELAVKAERAYERAQYHKSIRLYQKAIDQTAYVHGFYFGIARSLVAMGQYERASKFMVVAQSLSTTFAQQKLYARKVELLKRALNGPGASSLMEGS